VKIKNAKVGDVVTITGRVTAQRGGQTELWVPGIGESGRWSVVSSAEAENVTVQVEDIEQLSYRALVGDS
jgi:hypothetical protein